MKRIARIIVGGAVLLTGLAMLILPGPAIIVIPIGLAILAIDVPWAATVMQKVHLWLSRKRRSTPQHTNGTKENAP